MESDNFDKRLESVGTTIQRARNVFLFSNIASVIVLTGIFNLYFSWMRYLVTRQIDPEYSNVQKAVAQSRISDTGIISVPILGLKIFAGDIGIVASVGFFILTVWMMYSFRKENHSVGRLILDLCPEVDGSKSAQLTNFSQACRAMHALSSDFLFIGTENDDALGVESKKQQRPLRPGVVSGMVFLPGAVMSLVLAADIYSAFRTSRILPTAHNANIVDVSNQEMLIETVIRVILTLFVTVLIWRYVLRAKMYYDGTQNLYRRFVSIVAKHSETTAQKTNESGTT